MTEHPASATSLAALTAPGLDRFSPAPATLGPLEHVAMQRHQQCTLTRAEAAICNFIEVVKV